LTSLGSRIPITLSGIHLNGILQAAGTITLEGNARMYGAVMTAGTVVSGSTGLKLEVWYNADLGQGLFRGLPVVYRVPGTWQVKY
jgi:cytoskeletal protein CcmA (bactofilin family)